MRSIIPAFMVSLLSAPSAVVAQVSVHPFVTGSLARIRAADHGYQDVSQYGWIDAVGGGFGLQVVSPKGLGLSAAVEHHSAGNTPIYDVNFQRTGRFQPRATVTTASVEARIGRPGAVLVYRVGGVIGWQRGDITLARANARPGIRAGLTIYPFRGARIRPGIDLDLTRYFSPARDAGIRSILSPGLRIDF